MNLIYDIEGGHYNNVKASFLASAPDGTEVSRIFISGQDLIDYCKDNEVQILIVPYSGRQFSYAEIMHNGTHVFVAGKGFANNEATLAEFGGPISVGGGDTETKNKGEGAEIYTEALNFSLPQRHYTSYTCAYLAGLALSSGLLDTYTPFEFKQLVRQNAGNYPNHSTTQGFGKVTSISDDTISESLDVMNIQTYFTQGRGNLIFKRVKLPEYYSDDLKFYVDGEITTPDATLTDNFRKEVWLFWKSTGITNDNTFTATYFDPEIYNTGFIGANIPPYVIEDTFPVFNETFVSNGNVTHRAFKDGEKSYQECMKVRVYDGETVVYEEVSRSSSSFSLENVETGQSITFEVYANGLLYPETDKYDWNGSELTFTGTVYDPNEEPTPPEPEPDPETEPDPVDLDPEIESIRREGKEVLLITNNDATAKIYRKLKERDEWELVGETTEDTFTDEIDSAKNYIYAIRLSNSETESALSEPVYIAGRKNTSTVSQVGF